MSCYHIAYSNSLAIFAKFFFCLHNRLPANALFFTIVISLVIGLMCSGLIFMAYYHKVQVQRDQLRERLILNAESAIQLMLVSKDFQDSTKVMDLYGEQKDSVLMRKSVWGLFEVGYVRAFSHGDTVSRTFFMGTLPDSVWQSALYLLDQGRPVTLAGKTLIKGTAYLPEAGPKRGWVDGKNFEREKLVEGEIKKSGSKLPDLQQDFLKEMLKQVDCQYKGPSLPEKVLSQDSLVASFDQPTLRIHSKGRPLDLGRVVLKGNIIISSDTMITVSSHAVLQNVLLSAPVIKFKDDFKGSIQAFATDSILTGENCQFRYPSSLSLLEMDSVDNRPRLVLSKKCRMEGVLFQYVTFIDRSLATLTLKEGAEVSGQIYADGQTSMEGTLFGTLVCNKFLLTRPSGVYENHLLDCTLDRTQLSPHFLGSPLFSSQRKGIAQWLD